MAPAFFVFMASASACSARPAQARPGHRRIRTCHVQWRRFSQRQSHVLQRAQKETKTERTNRKKNETEPVKTPTPVSSVSTDPPPRSAPRQRRTRRRDVVTSASSFVCRREACHVTSDPTAAATTAAATTAAAAAAAAAALATAAAAAGRPNSRGSRPHR